MAIVKANLSGEDLQLSGGTEKSAVDSELSTASANAVQNKAVAKAINDLQSNLEPKDCTSLLTLDSNVIATNYGTVIFKVGKIVFITLNLTVKASTGADVIIGTLDESILPFIGPAINMVSNNGDGAYLHITGTNFKGSTTNPMGRIGFKKTNDSSKWVEGDGIRACFSYCIA